MQVARKVSTEVRFPSPREALRSGGEGLGVGGCITTQQTMVSTTLFRLSNTP
jgi:hypothetical protein